jgi:hypothetical protein
VDGYYLNRPLPGPPPRPRTTSPIPTLDVRPPLDFGNMRNPTPRTHRTRSAELVQRRWSGLDTRDVDLENKRASVNIAIALPPDHLEPPPPYSRYPDPPSTGHEPRPRPRSQLLPPPPPPSGNPAYYVKPYDPSEYAAPLQTQEIRRPVETVPIIAVPQPPTPVSPLNNIDMQYLAMRRRPATENNVTIENLLTHPMLRNQ